MMDDSQPPASFSKSLSPEEPFPHISEDEHEQPTAAWTSSNLLIHLLANHLYADYRINAKG